MLVHSTLLQKIASFSSSTFGSQQPIIILKSGAPQLHPYIIPGLYILLAVLLVIILILAMLLLALSKQISLESAANDSEAVYQIKILEYKDTPKVPTKDVQILSLQNEDDSHVSCHEKESACESKQSTAGTVTQDSCFHETPEHGETLREGEGMAEILKH